jgi:cobalamin biosynthesis protein CobT
MFKRMKKLGDRLEKDRKKGVKIEDQGPPEMALDDDSDSESSSSSSSSSSAGNSSGESDSDSEGEGSASNTKGGKSVAKAKKENDDSSDDGDDDDENSDSDDSSSSSSTPAEDNDDSPVASIAKAQVDPIFIHPRAASKAGFTHRSCFLCPVAVLKTEKSIVVHLQGSVSTTVSLLLYSPRTIDSSSSPLPS